MKDQLTSLAYGLGWRAVRTAPLSLTRPLFQAGADRAYRRNGPGVQRLRANLRRVLGPDVSAEKLETTLAAGMRSYARYWLEAFRLPSIAPTRVVSTMRVDGSDLLTTAYERGKGVIVALPHAGNWDHAGAWACLSGYRLSTVAERLKPESVYQRFLNYRRSLGMEILPIVGGDRPPLEILTDRLREGGLVVLLADRDMSSKGVRVSFFGGEIRVPAGPALLATRTEAALFTADLWYESDKSIAAVRPLELPTGDDRMQIVQATSQAIADRFAAGIARHPQDWHMLQRLWSDQTTTPTASTVDATR